MSNFPIAFAYTMINEGGSAYTNTPDDLGGPTKYGITLNTLSKFLGKTCSAIDVQNLTEDVAQAIYLKNYWTPLCCDQLPLIIAIALFDTEVNDGEYESVLLAQKCMGVVADGVVGPKTIAALNSTSTPSFIYKFIGGLQSHDVSICVSNSSQLKFLGGWLSRALKLYTLVVNNVN